MQVFMTTHSRYQPPPGKYIQALREPFADPNLYLDAARWMRNNTTPRYQCTHCHERLTRTPVHAFCLTSTMSVLDQEVNPSAASSNNDCPSKVFFDRYLLF